METLICACLSIARLVGLGLNAQRGWWWADPVAALATLPLVLRDCWVALVESRAAR
jgi:divalent metal cation (Fe/Co/Zn/Cd) transporter